MAFAAYCLIDGVAGEAKDEVHAGWIEVLNYNHDVRQRHNMGGGTGGLTGQGADFGTFVFSKDLDKASADLNKLCALGSQIKEVKIEVCSSVDGQKPIIEYTLKKAIVAGVSVAGGGDGRPHEQVELAYNEIAWKYTAYEDEGNKKEGEYTAGWNLATNKAV